MSQPHDADEASELSPRIRHATMGEQPWEVHNHYSQSKPPNGNGNAARVNNILLGCLLAIVGFIGIQVWNMTDRLARVETNVATLLDRP